MTTENVPYPCPRCRRREYEAWADALPAFVPELGDRLLNRVSGRAYIVVLPSEVGYEGDSYIQPCQPDADERCHAVVMVRGELDGRPRWLKLRDAHKVAALPGKLHGGNSSSAGSG